MTTDELREEIGLQVEINNKWTDDYVLALENKCIKLTNRIQLVKKSKKTRLRNLPNGTMFTMKDWDSFAFKSEYRTKQGACECYILGSGEMFWGGCKTADELNNLLVIPIEIKGSF